MEQIFSERQRKVFPYSNGVAQVWGDPVAIYRKMLAEFDGDLDLILQRSRDKSQPRLWSESVERLVEAVRKVFGMVPIDPVTGEGADETDCLAAAVAWREFLAAKKASAAS